MLNSTRLFLTLTLLIGTPSFAECPTTPPEDDLEESLDALEAEILTYGPLQDTGFNIGAQRVFRLQPVDEEGDALLDRLRRLAPDIEALQDEIGSTPNRAVVLMETSTDGFGASLAFTDCADAHMPHWLETDFSDMDGLPDSACLVVMFPERLENSRITDFSLAHEWMHTMQNSAYKHGADGESWWREGSADWFGHKIVPGTTERDRFIDLFFSRQPECELPEHEYDAQVFYFWAEEAFDSRWVFEQGLGGEERLIKTERVAETLPPDRWLDWAVAQAEGEIRFPDGRPLPTVPDWSTLEIGKTCRATVTAPPLSAAFREVTIAGDAAGPLRIDAGTSQVAIRGAGGDWVRATGRSTIDPPPASPFQLAAISPSNEELTVSLSTGDEIDGECTCYTGRWIELETAHRRGPFRYRSKIASPLASIPGASVAYDSPGPVLTIGAGGQLTVDDPFTIRTNEATVRFSTFQTFGTWATEDDAIAFEFEGKRVDTHVTSEYASGFVSNPDRSTGAVGGKWRPICDGNRLTLERWMFTPGDPPSEVREFIRAE